MVFGARTRKWPFHAKTLNCPLILKIVQRWFDDQENGYNEDSPDIARHKVREESSRDHAEKKNTPFEEPKVKPTPHFRFEQFHNMTSAISVMNGSNKENTLHSK